MEYTLLLKLIIQINYYGRLLRVFQLISLKVPFFINFGALLKRCV